MEKASVLAEKAKESIEKFNDTVKLKLHLASMDTKDTWRKLEKQINAISDDIRTFSRDIKQETDEARLQGHLALMDAKLRWEEITDDLDQWVTAISNNTEEKIDIARLKMVLAKMEAKEFFSKAEHEANFHSVGQNIKEEWYSLLSKMDERLIDFINRFPLK